MENPIKMDDLGGTPLFLEIRLFCVLGRICFDVLFVVVLVRAFWNVVMDDGRVVFFKKFCFGILSNILFVVFLLLVLGV